MPRGVKGSGSGYVHSSVWNSIDSLPGDSVKVALGLCKLAGKPGRWTGPFIQIMAVTGMSRKATISNALALLEAKGVIQRKRQNGTVSEYLIYDQTVTPGVTVCSETVTPVVTVPPETVTPGVTVASKVLPDGSPLQPPSLTPLQEIDTSCKRDITVNRNGVKLNEKFEELWKLYPRKEGKAKSLKFCELHVQKNRATWDDLVVATKRYAESVAGKETQYILVATTFYGTDGRWHDFIDGNYAEPQKAVDADPLAHIDWGKKV